MIKVIYQLFDAQKLLPLTKQSQNTKLSIFLEIFRFCNLERDLKSDFRSIEKSCITKYSYFIRFNFFRTVKLVSCALKRTLSLEQNCNKHCTKSWNIRKMQIISMEDFPISCKASFFSAMHYEASRFEQEFPIQIGSKSHKVLFFRLIRILSKLKICVELKILELFNLWIKSWKVYFSIAFDFSFEFIFLFPELHWNRMQEKKQRNLQN